MSSIRAFVAVDVDERSIVERVIEVQRTLATVGADIKFVEPNNLHITLRFMGEIPPRNVELARKALSELRYRQFDIRLSGLGAFPNTSSPRVIWIGIGEGAERLRELRSLVENAVGRYASHHEEREFSPHLTIGRVKGPGNKGKLSNALRELASIEFGIQRVDSIKLKKSTLTPRGPIYEDLLVVRLE